MRDFIPPKTDTKTNGPVRLDYAFQLKARYDPLHLSQTTRGGRIYQDIVSGEIVSPRLNASVYPDSGGQYDTVQEGKVRDVAAHFILKADNGEYIYVEHAGFHRPDGYYRAIAYIDADTKGTHDWLNNTTFVVTAEESADLREVTFTYYAAN